ncbi:tetratricopeptide repeat protein [Cellulophaga sp. HaHaR_3_176]|uniref:tetratricopeptide repeat-containing sensor histidine kinase n=1 Tax=Cellulophaga sp. HaHaR_3_176 TaxID=1942464 RepID=UPI001C1F285A|nr:tetratricopeptide repeat protein [Cellulophaga sp. HaHaR_3_176]QWX83793.1 tetratricopeptide repeat protein [Cellulophaga sp. HaHaR_3_176]
MHQPSKRYIIQLRLYLLVFLFSFNFISSQEISNSFKKKVDSIIHNKPETYIGINSVMGSSKSDTILMKYFSDVAALKKYLSGQCYALNQLGTKYRNISRYNKAIKYHKLALEKADEANNLELKVFSLNMLSVVYRRMDAIKTALDYAQEALELAETEKNPSIGLQRSINISLNGIGNIYQSLKQYDLAIEKFNKSLNSENNLHNRLGLAINNQNVGECYEELNNLDLALNYYRKSLALNEEMDNEMGRIICHNSIAQVYIKQKKNTQAYNILIPTLKKAKKLGDNYLTSIVLINTGWTLMDLQQYEQSEANLFEGVQLASKHKLQGTQAIGYKLLSELYSKKKEYEKSLFYFKESKNIEENLANETNIRYVNDILFKYDTEKKNNQIAILAKENELVRIKLKRNENTILIGALLLSLLALILYILYRQFQLKSEKKLLTLEQSMLRSQMNPHFLFNSLNSIKLYIINNEKKNAVYYLNKFSKLVRKILEASSLKEISLAEELETVELYMNIENIRFSNEIDFEINIEEGLDIHAIKIPSLILQPFLENAIWHGLSSKKDNKSIKIDILKKNDYFNTICITDNGIGRDASEVIKKNKVLKRKSIGIDITKERLENFSKDYQNTFEVKMIDLFDAEKKPIGTKVLITIPTI